MSIIQCRTKYGDVKFVEGKEKGRSPQFTVIKAAAHKPKDFFHAQKLRDDCLEYVQSATILRG